MSYSPPSIGAVAISAAASYSANLPASIPVGSLLLLGAASRTIGTTTMSDPAGYRRLAAYVNGLYLWGRIAGASEVAPTVSQSGADLSEARMFCFTGNTSDITTITDAQNSQLTSTPTSGQIPYNALTLTAPFELVIIGYAQRGTAWTSASAVAGFSILSDDPDSGGSVMSMGWQYQIQNAQTNIPAGHVSITGGSTNPVASVIIALKAAAYVPYPPTALGGMNVQVCQ